MGEQILRITRWSEFYEPPRRDAQTAGKLKFVRWMVRADPGDAYRTLFDRDPEIAPAAFGLFAKLLELAADQERESRDGCIRYRGRPATIQNVAFKTLFAPATIKKCLGLLTDPDVGWVEWVDVDDVPRPAADGDQTAGLQVPSSERPELDGSRTAPVHEPSVEALRDPSLPNRTRDIPYQTIPNTETGSDSKALQKADSGSARFGPAKGSKLAIFDLLDLLGVSVPTVAEATPYARKLRAWKTQIHDVVEHVSGMDDPTEGLSAIVQIARDVSRDPPEQRMPRWIKRCKDRGLAPAKWMGADQTAA